MRIKTQWTSSLPHLFKMESDLLGTAYKNHVVETSQPSTRFGRSTVIREYRKDPGRK